MTTDDVCKSLNGSPATPSPPPNLRQAWRSSRAVLNLVPGARRKLISATIITIFNGVFAVAFGLSLGPAIASVGGNGPAFFRLLPVIFCVAELVTAIKPTSDLITLSEQTRLQALKKIVDDALEQNDDETDIGGHELSLATSRQLDETRQLLVDTWRWIVAQFARLGISVAALGTMVAVGFGSAGPLAPVAMILGVVLTTVVTTAVTTSMSVRKHKKVDDESIEVNRLVHEDIVETDIGLASSLGGHESTKATKERIGESALRLLMLSTDDRHWAKWTSNLNVKIVQLTVAALPLIAGPMMGISAAMSTSLTTATVLGLTLTPAATGMAELIGMGVSTFTTSTSRLGDLLARLTRQQNRGTRSLSSSHTRSSRLAIRGLGIVRADENGAREVLSDVDVDLDLGGAIHVIKGPSGTGKSTWLRVATGRLMPTTGSVALGDVPFEDIERSSLRSRIALIPQTLKVHPEKTLEQLGGFESGEQSDHGSRHGRWRAIMTGLNLSNISDKRRWGTLSGGQQLRAAIALTLAGEADVIALDEPTNHLDDTSKRQLAKVINDAVRDGKTFLIATHDSLLLTALGDHSVLELRPKPNGPSKLVRHPITRSVRDADRQRPPSNELRDGHIGRHRSRPVPPTPSSLRSDPAALRAYELLMSAETHDALEALAARSNSPDERRRLSSLAQRLKAGASFEWLETQRSIAALNQIGCRMATRPLDIRDSVTIADWFVSVSSETYLLSLATSHAFASPSAAQSAPR